MWRPRLAASQTCSTCFKTMLGEAGKRFNNPLRALALFGKAVRHIRVMGVVMQEFGG